MTRAILWDIDGVLIHYPHYYEDTLDEADHPGARQALKDYYRSPSVEACDRGRASPLVELAPVLKSLGWNLSPRAFLDAQYAYEATLVRKDYLGAIGDLRRAGRPCFLASNQNPDRKAFLRRILDADRGFDGAFFSCDCGHVKREPEFWSWVLERLSSRPWGLEPQDLVYLDDDARNLAEAARFGIPTREIRGPEDVEAFLRGAPSGRRNTS